MTITRGRVTVVLLVTLMLAGPLGGDHASAATDFIDASGELNTTAGVFPDDSDTTGVVAFGPTTSFNRSITSTDSSAAVTAAGNASGNTTLEVEAGALRNITSQGSTSASASGSGASADGESNLDIGFEISSPENVSITGSLDAANDNPGSINECSVAQFALTRDPDFSPFLQLEAQTGSCFSDAGSQADLTQDLELEPGAYELDVLAATQVDDPGSGTSRASATWDFSMVFEGDCTITVNGPGVTTNGTPGADVICGTEGDDTINGLGGVDTIFGRGGKDNIDGGPGNDQVEGGGDDDVLQGGLGEDDVFGDGGNDFIIGSDFGLPPNDGENILDGGPGDDIIGGGDGKDTMFGRDGRDILNGLEGDDTIDAGRGDDGPLADDFGVFGGKGNDFILLGDGNDEARGEEGDDEIRGGPGRDRMRGNGGSDKLIGQGENDLLIGGTRKDVLDGGSGNDTFNGVDGVRDVARGGSGAQDTGQFDAVDEVSGVEGATFLN